MINLLTRFKTKVKTDTIFVDYSVQDISRPSDTKMKEWRELGFVRHDVINGDLVYYQEMNWALERAGKNVRVVKGNLPTIDMLQLLYDESIKYLQEIENVE